MPRAYQFVLLLGVTLAIGQVACDNSSTTELDTCSTTGAALSVCTTGPTVQGVDISYYQGVIDFGAVRSGGYEFAIARVSDGTGFIDPKFATNWSGIKAAGLVRGVYQFFRPGDDPVAQADLLIAQVAAAGGFDAADLPPVMDIEATDGESPATVQAHMQTWLTRVEQATGIKPLIYSALFMSGAIGSNFGAYPLWVANYGVTCPNLPGGWSAWKFWQYTSVGAIPGISGHVDTNYFNGTIADLKAFASQGKSVPVTTPPPQGEDPTGTGIPLPSHDPGKPGPGGSVMGGTNPQVYGAPAPAAAPCD